MAIEIHRVIFEKKQLADIPKAERSLLLLMGHATNELNVLSKFILMMRKDDPPTQVEDFAEGGQIFIIMRILIGKLHEAWELFKARTQSDKDISEKYLKELDNEAVEALTSLNGYFGKKNAVTEIRNKVAFHYKDKDDLIEENFQRLPETEPWEFYLSKTHGNTFYYLSEMVVTGSALSLAGKIDAEQASLAGDIKAFSELTNDVLEVSKNITTLFSRLISDILTAYVPEPAVKTEKFDDGPKLSEFMLPYFFDEDEEDWTRKYREKSEGATVSRSAMEPVEGDDDTEESNRPSHLGRTLWRYMSFTKFLWLIQNKRLWLARADTMSDPWELALAGDQLEHVILRRPISPLDSIEPEEPIRDRAQRINREWRESTFISCWSSADHESYALWKIFCGSNDGVAISVPTRWLSQALGNVKLYVVTYSEPGTELRTPTAMDLATKKRLMFEYEREVRAIATVDTPDPKLGKGEFGFTYDIDPEKLITGIALHPEADSTLMDAVMRAVDDYAPQLRDKVEWSRMRAPPPLLKKK